jgi:nucleolar GTP-binding protein
MFKEIPQVLIAEDLINKSFNRMNKIQKMDRVLIYQKKKTIIAKTEAFSKTIIEDLNRYVKKFPSIDNLNPFYQEIIEIKINKDHLKKSLGAVDWARKTCVSIYRSQSKSLLKSKQINFLIKKQREIIGRITSIIKQIDKDLKLLSDASRLLHSLPELSNYSTVVIAGYPNVGKSSLLKCLSSAKPKVAQYPFTTKEIYLGHMIRKEKYSESIIQIIDTPGLLDDSLKNRNKIERLAIAALKHLSDVIVFMLDPTEICGYTLKNQKKLLIQLKKIFDDSVFIVIENKSDIKKFNSRNLKISCVNKVGIDELIEKIVENIKKDDIEINGLF